MSIVFITFTSSLLFGNASRLTPCQFTGCSFGTAAIWQYESLKSRVQSYFNEVRADWLEKLRPQKQGHIRKQVKGLTRPPGHWSFMLLVSVRTDEIVHVYFFINLFQINQWWNSLSEGQQIVSGRSEIRKMWGSYVLYVFVSLALLTYIFRHRLPSFYHTER